MSGRIQQYSMQRPEISISSAPPAKSPISGYQPRDSGAAGFSLTQTNQTSPAKEECSEDESFQVGIDGRANKSSIHSFRHEESTASVASLRHSSSKNLSGLVSNVYRTTGSDPPGLVGASTTICGDRLYVFGGRRIRPQRLTSSLYELDLISRHWTKLQTNGDIPSPRFFHSLCVLGDRTLVCFGGMTLGTSASESTSHPPKPDSESTMTVTADLYVYDIPSHTWTALPTSESPSRRYAHCATILPSSAVFSSASAPLSALRHNPSSNIPNKGTLGMAIDGKGGAEMLVVGGQDGQSHFIDTIEVFNFRSLKWTSSTPLNKSYGAYRSIVAPLLEINPSEIGCRDPLTGQRRDQGKDRVAEQEVDAGSEHVSGSPMIIFSNYNFLNTQIELQIRHEDGTVTEKQHRGEIKPPGLRFPTGAVVNNTLIVSGTFITSTQQEFMTWALDLPTLVWHRVDVGTGTFSSGSWNRGVLWRKRNAFVLLGNRRRRLGDDYSARRINFSNICILELEALGLYENPNRTMTETRYATKLSRPLSDVPDNTIDGRQSEISLAGENIGLLGLRAREMCDMEILARDGERIPVSSQMLRQRWGLFFHQLCREDIARAESLSDNATLTESIGNVNSRYRSSISTVTPSINSSVSNGGIGVNDWAAKRPPSAMSNSTAINVSKQTSSSAPSKYSRVLYLPHTYLTVRALVHYLYTLTLPALNSAFCTPQILCSLLQIARPYRIDGLLEATVERLHQVLDARNTAAVFNAAAMAAGGGETIRFAGEVPSTDSHNGSTYFRGKSPADSGNTRDGAASQQTIIEDDSEDADSSASGSTASISDIEDSVDDMNAEIWQGEMSSVIGLQKRGLRGLMEGRKVREQGKYEDVGVSPLQGPGAGNLGVA